MIHSNSLFKSLFSCCWSKHKTEFKLNYEILTSTLPQLHIILFFPIYSSEQTLVCVHSAPNTEGKRFPAYRHRLVGSYIFNKSYSLLAVFRKLKPKSHWHAALCLCQLPVSHLRQCHQLHLNSLKGIYFFVIWLMMRYFPQGQAKATLLSLLFSRIWFEPEEQL